MNGQLNLINCTSGLKDDRTAHIESISAVDPESLARKLAPCSLGSGKALETMKEAASSGERPYTLLSMKGTSPVLISSKNLGVEKAEIFISMEKSRL